MKNHTLLAFGVIFSLMLMALVVNFLVYKTPKVAVISSNRQPQNLALIVNNLDKQLEARFPSLRKSIANQNDAIGYQLAGYDFQIILPRTATDLTFSISPVNSQNDNSVINSAKTTVANYLQQEDFRLQPTNNSSSLLTVSFYRSATAICQIITSNLLDITCSPLSRLTTIAQQSQSLVKLYATATSSGVNSVTAPIFLHSQTPDYNLAVLDIFNGSGETKVNYYRHGASDWQLVNLGWYNDPAEDGNITPNCADFESVAAVRAAFSGQTCYDSADRRANIIN
jgi:hypothetical protein